MTPVKRNQNWMPSLFNDFWANDWSSIIPTRKSSNLPAMNIIEKENRQHNGDHQKSNVINTFRLIDIQPETVSKLCHKQLIDLQRKVGAEETGNTQGGDRIA